MMKTSIIYWVSIFLLAVLGACSSHPTLIVKELQCEKLINPLAIDHTKPYLSWQLEAKDNGLCQSAYQILVATDEDLLTEEKADLWNSGKVESPESAWVLYQGNELASKEFVYWKVRVWDGNDKASDWSETACFGIGLLHPSDWKASYIGSDTLSGKPQSPLLWKHFQWNQKGTKAFLHVNSLGYHEVYLNGKKVGDAVLAPAVSQFDKRSLSVTYDVTGLLEKGENDFVLWLGKGWYQDGLPGVVNGGPFVRAQLEEFENGEWRTSLITDSTWKTRESGYVSTSTWRPWQFGGEEIHADCVLPDLGVETLNAVSWNTAVLAAIPEHQVSPQMAELNGIREHLHPLTCKASGDSAWIYDLGTNLTGWTKIQFPPLEKGQKIRISYCDFLDDKGEFRDHLYEDYYIASGADSAEVFSNKFNYHAYRYLKLTNLKEAPALSAITASLVHTNYSGESFFACSDKDLNAIHDMIHYTLRCLTLGGYMVDCPQIERLGYGGDGNASTPTVQTMFNLSPLYMNWMQSWADCMREDGSLPHTAPNPYAAGGGPFWCGFIITASWQTYLNYGDRRLLDRYYPYMQQWLEYVAHYTVDGLLKKWPDTSYRNWYLGDWATPVGIDQTNPLSVDLVDNCYIAVCYQTMSKIASLLNKADDSRGYKAKYDALTKRIQETFYDAKGNTYASGTQIDLVYPMLAGVTPDNLKETVLKTLYEVTANRFQGHLATGLVGIPVLTEWAVKNGQAEWMYQMLKKRDYPGYLYMLDNGATTTWEHWNGERSHIHNCYNGIGAWFYQALAGIMPDESQPGYKHIWIKPQVVNDISWVQASKDTPYGLLKVRWEKKEASFVLDVQIPVGASASVSLPFPVENVRVNGQPSESKETLDLESGSYRIECSL
ncbi:MAG: family 78 glycoside hydrolase catalytic domain [Bacteroidales bacterium]|nr:family 78 glycoside hydrolase catalytic domain [Bacteroidales bacterium]